MRGNFISALLAILAMRDPACAENPVGHAKFHHFYRGLNQPGSGASCCNDNDCRPVPYRVTPTGVEILIAGRWIRPPDVRTMEIETPDAGAHWCGIESTEEPLTFCAIIPRSGV